MNVDEAATLFLMSLGGKAQLTVVTYSSNLRRFGEFRVESHGPDTTDAITDTTLQDFHAWLVRRYGRGCGTVITVLAGVRAFFRYLSRRKLLAPTVTYESLADNAREVIGRRSYRTPRVTKDLAFVVLYAKAMPTHTIEALRDRALILSLFSTGMRRAEVASLNRTDIDNGWQPQAIIRGKGDKERVAFFSEETLAAVRAYLDARHDDYEPVFIRHDRARGKARGRGENYRLSPQSVWMVVSAISGQAGVPITPHAFRHAKATVLLNQGAQLSEVQDILGHASPETTKLIYAHYETQHLRSAFDRYSLSAEEMALRLAH